MESELFEFNWKDESLAEQLIMCGKPITRGLLVGRLYLLNTLWTCLNESCG